MRTSTLAARKNAAVESPWGPAPTIATSQAVRVSDREVISKLSLAAVLSPKFNNFSSDCHTVATRQRQRGPHGYSFGVWGIVQIA
jgi:hypothetical protein